MSGGDLTAIERAVASLSASDREVFLAHRVDGFSYGQIAAVTGIPVEGVEKRIARAMAAIDRALSRLS